MCPSLKQFGFGPTLPKKRKKEKQSQFTSIYDFCVHSSKIKTNVANNTLKLHSVVTTLMLTDILLQ